MTGRARRRTNETGIVEFKATFGARLPDHQCTKWRRLAGNAKHDLLWQTGRLWQYNAGADFGNILDEAF